MNDTLRNFPVDLVRDNRAKGLLRELMDAIDAEDSSLALSRLSVALRAASHRARCRSGEIEKATRELERAQNARPRRPQTRKWRLP